MTKPLAPTHKIYQHLAVKIEHKAVDSFRKDLVLAGEQNAKTQLIIALTAQAIADAQRGRNAVPSLADTIISQQDHKLERYGDNAYSFSEKQIDVIVRDIMGV